MRNFQVSEAVLTAIRVQIGSFRAERGGMLGQDSDGVIRHFIPDCNASCGAAEYNPDIAYLNQVIPIWKSLGITFCGFAHSHPRGCRQPSYGDEIYAANILKHFERLDMLWIPIIQTVPNSGKFEILPFAAIRPRRQGSPCKIKRAGLSIVEPLPKPNSRSNANTDFDEFEEPVCDLDREFGYETDTLDTSTSEADMQDVASTFGQSSSDQSNGGENLKFEAGDALPHDVQLDSEYPRLERLAKAFDLGRHAKTQLVVVGAGGGASFILNCARMGVGKFVLIDPDTVSASNVATQLADPSSIGEYKVHTLAKQIKNINPSASVLPLAKRIEDIGDSEFAELFGSKDHLKPNIAHQHGTSGTILMVLTDNFRAQARGHRLALQFGVPTICAQEYREGLGAEVTFTVPGLTPACHRCLTSSRYQAYLDSNFSNDTTSEGAPIFAAEFLNAVLGHVLLAVLYSGTSHPRFGALLNQIRDRNLIRVRMDPSFDDVFGDAFSRRISGAYESECFRMLDCIFLFQTPDMGQSPSRPRCPDCLGSGNLADAIGTFADTREMRPSAL